MIVTFGICFKQRFDTGYDRKGKYIFIFTNELSS